MKFQESELAHQYLDGLHGLEIGGSAHNSFGLNTLNVDYTDDMDTAFKKAEEALCGEKMPVDIIADGVSIPVPDESYDFIISSHTIEHIFDPIKALKEWYRIIKKGGYIFTIAPITAFVPNETRPTTTLQELIDRHTGLIKQSLIVKKIEDNSKNALGQEIVDGILYDQQHGHWTVLDMDLIKSITQYLKYDIIETQEVDDKVGNGFTFIIQKP